MKLRKLGSSNLMVSPIAIGCWSYGSNSEDYWGKQKQKNVDIVVQNAVESGVNFFDTALGYNNGRSEKSLGKAIKNIREKVIICDKIPNSFAPSEYEKTIDLMLSNLNTPYMDLLLLHWPTSNDDDNKRRLEAMVALQDKGKVLNIGVSNFGIKQLDSISEFIPKVCANELCHNIVSRGIENGITSKCIENEIGIIGYSPLNQGLLTGKYRTIDEIPTNYTRTRQFSSTRVGSRHGSIGAEDDIMNVLELLDKTSKETNIPVAQISLAWSIAKTGITTTIVGCRNQKQLLSNKQAGEIQLSQDIINAIDAVSHPIIDKIGYSSDYYESVDNGRIW